MHLRQGRSSPTAVSSSRLGRRTGRSALSHTHRMSSALVGKQSKLDEPSSAAAAKDPLHCSWRSKWWSWSGRATSRRSRRAGQFCRRRPLWCDLPARRQVLEKRHRRDPATCWVLIAARAARSCQHGVHVPGAGASHVAAVPVRRCPACSSACAEVLDHACAEITLCCRLLCHRPRITTAPPRSRPRPGHPPIPPPLHCPRQCPRPTLAQRCATERVAVPGARPAALRVRVRVSVSARASPVVRWNRLEPCRSPPRCRPDSVASRLQSSRVVGGRAVRRAVPTSERDQESGCGIAWPAAVVQVPVHSVPRSLPQGLGRLPQRFVFEGGSIILFSHCTCEPRLPRAAPGCAAVVGPMLSPSPHVAAGRIAELSLPRPRRVLPALASQHLVFTPSPPPNAATTPRSGVRAAVS